MKKLLIAFVLLPALLVSQKTITLEDVWSKGTFAPKYTQGFYMLKNGTSYTELKVMSDGSYGIAEFDLKTGKEIGVMVQGNDVKYNEHYLDITNYAFSPNEDKLLFWNSMEHIYRHSFKATYHVYDIASKKTLELSPAGKAMFPTFSPDGKKIAYVMENNLYILDLSTGREITVTGDGEFNKIKNGWGDWVYEEEFSKAEYFSWSADSRYLAYVKFDERKVKEFTLDYYKGDLYPVKYTFKYPKAGEDNSIVSVHVYNIEKNATTTVEIGTETDIYIPRIEFTNSANTLCVQRLNRLQNKLDYLFCNSDNGQSKVVLTEESKTYVDITDDLVFVANTGFIISSEKDGYNHLYYYDLTGKLIQQITKGAWDVMEFKGFDAAKNLLYFTSTESGAIHRDVCSVQLDGKNKKSLSDKKGFNDITLVSGNKFYIYSYSDANTPKFYELKSTDGKFVKILEDNSALKEKIKEYNLSKRSFFKFKTSEGVELNGWMMKPVNFDSTKKHPVYMYAYGGPGSNLCNNSWGGSDYFWHNVLTQKGYMVVCVDGRGTMGRGREFKHSTYLQLGKLETMDQIEVAKYLGTLPYVDKSRIGFQGWSYGGYMASLMISKGADVIKAAIAVAPVTNWKYYDNIYTERFLRTPKENKSGYEDNSPTNFVKNIKGKFLLIHGSADDNVHMQNSMELADAMVKNNIPFDFMIYPNKNHGIGGGLTRLHIYSKILKFVTENL
ncbi:MAG: S9 family peptidase [Bacteroidia bacterium]|jgi:dipeptidyl-peptidase-4|nr:S9 family peptidase [Bacteroidia bacterium]